jgi:hypothetical protein
MRQNVPENIEEKVVPSQVLKQDIIIDRVKAATMKVPLVISELNTKAVVSWYCYWIFNSDSCYSVCTSFGFTTNHPLST